MFPSTQRSVLDAAARHQELGPQAMGALIDVYWQPCHRYLRLRFRRSTEDAEDLVQGFFAVLIEQEILRRYDPARGPFRPYLRACLDHFVLKEQERVGREKHGGRATLIPLDSGEIAAEGATSEEVFHREWQRRLFTLALGDLRQMCRDTDRTIRYQVFAAYDLADGARPRYEDLATEYGLPVTTITNHLAWARRELRRLLDERLSTVTSSERERRSELRSLFATDQP